MEYMQHNLVNMLYAIKSAAEAHLALVEEGKWKDPGARLEHAENVLQRAFSQAYKAIELTKRIGWKRKKTALKRSVIQPLEKTCLYTVWNRVQTTLEREFLAKQIRMIVRIPENFSYLACLSRDFEEMLYHLGKNAFQAAPDSGHIILRAEYGFSDDDHLCAMITVANTGPGIAEDTMPSIFTPFFTTKSLRDGNGLGLSITRQLVTKNKGKISVLSSPCSGTAFILEFPFH